MKKTTTNNGVNFSDKFKQVITDKYNNLKKVVPDFNKYAISRFTIDQLVEFFERFFSTPGWENATDSCKEATINSTLPTLVYEIKPVSIYRIPCYEWTIIVDDFMTATYRYYFR